MKNLFVVLTLLAPFIFGSIAFAYNVDEETQSQTFKQDHIASEAIADASLKTQDIDLTVPGQILHIYKAMNAADTSTIQTKSMRETAVAQLNKSHELMINHDDIMMNSLPENNIMGTIHADEKNENLNNLIESGNNVEETANIVLTTTVESTNTLEETTDALESAKDIIEPDHTAESVVDAEPGFVEDMVEPQSTQEEDPFAAEDFTENELDLLARLVRAEAQTEPLEGKIAVACVVLNRVKSPQFPDTIKGVIYQSNQFQPVANNQINKPADSESIEAVKAALTDHDDMAQDSLFFYNPDIATSRWLDSRQTTVVIGQHVFKK